ncbi:MAG: D-alanyl-D-alanine carboxypeptidase/D-alanyl-D-alanine-endopeptidase [Thiotrichales bacterium]|nr:D-alanyl-D-alanine carboxypeptidase/D-alanyl-D-alanine-endopeptidase [Thiotrichales bacterium]
MKTAVVLLVLCVHAAQANSTLPAEIIRVLDKHKLPHHSMSLYIREIGTSLPLLDYQSNEPRNPASVMKMVTTLAGLELLGPDYVWETNFHSDGKVNGNTLNGNLIIEGGGDPFLVRETFWHMLYTLQLRGIKHIKGDLIIDNTLFEPEPGTTGDFDRKPYRAYNVFPDAALLNFTAQSFILIPRHGKLHIYADPPSSTLTIRNKVTITKGRCRGLRSSLKMHVTGNNSGQTIVEFSGQYPERCGEREMLRSVTNNSQFLFGVFKSLWEEMGGTISGTGKTGQTPENTRILHRQFSRPLYDIIDYINKHSNNVMARQLLLTIGKETQGAPATRAAGENAIRGWITKKNINSDGIIIENGSGLSRKARIKARTLADLLEQAWQSPFQPEFLSSLPIAGVDGTMKKRLNSHISAGSMRIKTGLLRDVRSMAGYVTTQSGKSYVMVSFQNHRGVQNWTGTEVQDALLKWLYKNH